MASCPPLRVPIDRPAPDRPGGGRHGALLRQRVGVLPWHRGNINALADGRRLAGGRLWPGLAVADDDLVVEKTARSAFFPGRSQLPGLLADRGIDTVVATGTLANVCVEASVRDLNATLHVVYRSYGDVRPTSEVLDLVHAGARTCR